MSNEITVKGVLGSDPELRYTQTGVAVATLRLADNTSRLNKDTNSWEQVGETIWWNVSVWNALGENSAALLKKGEYIEVTGPVSFRSFEKDGEHRESKELRASAVVRPITQKKSGGNAGGGYSAPATPNAPIAVDEEESPF